MKSYRRKGEVGSQQIPYQEGITTPEDFEKFEQLMHRRGTSAAAWWYGMVRLPPTVRLMRNLSALTLECVRKRKHFTTVIPDGVTERELEMLHTLEGLDIKMQVVGHELLNIRERQVFVDTFRTVLNAYKCKEGTIDGESTGDQARDGTGGDAAAEDGSGEGTGV